MIIVVEQFGVGAGTSDDYDFGVANAAFVASLGGRAAYCLDSRVPQNALGRPCVAEPYTGTDPATGGVATFGRVRAIANVTYILNPFNYVLAPGTGFGVFANTVNITRNGFFFWRERAAKDGELT